MTAVWERSRHAGTDLLMLLALADFSDDQGNSYPSVPTLAEKCRMKLRNANYILKALQTSGELQVRANEGPKGTNRYRIVLEALTGVQSLAGMQRSAGVQSTVATPAMECTRPLQPIAPEPSLNRQEPSRRSARKRSTPSTALNEADLQREGVQAQHATDWIQVRKAKRSPLTPTAWAAFKREATKAGISVDAAVQFTVEAGWQGFKADWYSDRKAKQRADPFDGVAL
jgi:hypothetical protein